MAQPMTRPVHIYRTDIPLSDLLVRDLLFVGDFFFSFSFATGMT